LEKGKFEKNLHSSCSSKLEYIGDAIENPVTSVMPQLLLFHIKEY